MALQLAEQILALNQVVPCIGLKAPIISGQPAKNFLAKTKKNMS